MARSWRIPLILMAFAGLIYAPADSGAAERDAAQELVEAYEPILMIREEQDPPCEKSAEQYEATTVDTVLGNPDVRFTEATPGDDPVLKKGPTAADLAEKGDSFHLDLQGDPLGETCVYSKDFKRLKREGKAPATTYAHIAREKGKPGLAVQYWFFWYFNQFNDLHEGDWEGMQVVFEADNPEQALKEGPSEVGLFQHGGGEKADWEDAKVQKEGDHPIVYPAAGSHATFYDSAVYVENGQGGSGVGCDNTSEPLRRLDVKPVVVPTHADPDGRFAWLTYEGHWGQLEKGFNNGPTGPNTKTRWLEPMTWMTEIRTSSPHLPGGSIIGPQVTGAFCGAVATASDLINLDARSHLAVLAILGGILLLIAYILFRTKWGPVDLEQLRAKRAFGQLIRAARQFYGRHWRTLLPIGLTAIPIVGGVRWLSELISTAGGVDEATGRAGSGLAVGDLLQSIAEPVAAAVVGAVVIVAIRTWVEARRMRVGDSFRGMLARFWRVVGGQLLATLYVLLMAITVIGLPFAAWKYIAWQFVQQEILFEDKGIREAFRGSSAIVRGRWWHTVKVAGFLLLVGVVIGPVVGFALIFTNLSLLLVNLIGSLIFALLVPYIAVGHTLLYFDLQARAEQEPARTWRERMPERWQRRLPGRLRPTPAEA
ncbi:MAG TPA: hypothetical protein VIT85_02285 [Solirubrobacterales bacterium]